MAAVSAAVERLLTGHGAHHSLLMRLLSPLQNHRVDRYGGTPENRWRVQIKIVEAIRAAVGEDFPILFRFSAADFVSGGVDLSLTIPYAQALEAAGVEADYQKSLALYQQVEQKLVDDAASLPLWFGQNYILIKPYVNGYQLNPLGFAWLNRVSVD